MSCKCDGQGGGDKKGDAKQTGGILLGALGAGSSFASGELLHGSDDGSSTDDSGSGMDLTDLFSNPVVLISGAVVIGGLVWAMS